MEVKGISAVVDERPAGRAARWLAPFKALMALAVLGMLGGCAVPPALTVASYVGDGILMITTGKSSTDLGLSLAMGKNCSTWHIVKEEYFCQDDVSAKPEAIPAEVAQDDSVAQRQIAHVPTDEVARSTMARRTLDIAFELPAVRDGAGLGTGSHGRPVIAAALPRPGTPVVVAMASKPTPGGRAAPVRVASAGRPDTQPLAATHAPARPRHVAHARPHQRPAAHRVHARHPVRTHHVATRHPVRTHHAASRHPTRTSHVVHRGPSHRSVGALAHPNRRVGRTTPERRPVASAASTRRVASVGTPRHHVVRRHPHASAPAVAAVVPATPRPVALTALAAAPEPVQAPVAHAPTPTASSAQPPSTAPPQLATAIAPF